MGFFDSKSSTVQNTTSTVENQHATAGADGFAVGAGSNVQIEEVSDEIAIAALDANERNSRDAFGLVEEANDRLGDFADSSLDQVSFLARTSLDKVSDSLGGGLTNVIGFAGRALADNKDLVEKQLEANNRFARDQSELIAAQAGVVAPTDARRNQNLVFGALALVGILVLVPIFKPGKS